MPATLAPASSHLTHVYARRLAVREATEGEGDGRTIYGLAVPFDTELEVCDWWDDYAEVFRKGSFAKTIRDRAHPVPLLVAHEHRGLPIGVATELTETDTGLEAAFHLAHTAKADEVLELVRADAISGLSIGFEPVKHTETKGRDRTPPSALDLHERTEVRLREVSICNFPAYPTAGVAGVRAELAQLEAAAARHPARPPVAALADRRATSWAARAGHVDRFNRVVRR